MLLAVMIRAPALFAAATAAVSSSGWMGPPTASLGWNGWSGRSASGRPCDQDLHELMQRIHSDPGPTTLCVPACWAGHMGHAQRREGHARHLRRQSQRRSASGDAGLHGGRHRRCRHGARRPPVPALTFPLCGEAATQTNIGAGWNTWGAVCSRRQARKQKLPA